MTHLMSRLGVKRTLDFRFFEIVFRVDPHADPFTHGALGSFLEH
jgi:hypothetical protein